jgi:hypothetical protein
VTYVGVRRGTAIVYYSRMRNGMPDPDAWHSDCPAKRGTLWFAEKVKTLPVDRATGAWDFTVRERCTLTECNGGGGSSGVEEEEEAGDAVATVVPTRPTMVNNADPVRNIATDAATKATADVEEGSEAKAESEAEVLDARKTSK